MTFFPAPPDERLANLVLSVLIRHGRVPAFPGWSAEIAPGGSTDRTFRVFDLAGVPRLTARLARPGLVDRLRHEQRILLELASEPATAPIDLAESATPLKSADPTLWAPRDVALIEDAALPEGWLLVHEHVPGQPALVADVRPADRERLGECLAWLHGHRRDSFTIWPSLDALQGTRSDLFRERLATLRRYESAQDRLADSATLLDQLARLEFPARAGWQERDFALCHGDLSAGNILWDSDAVALIDWEFARDGDPAEDIAYLVAEQNLSPALVAEIAEAYVGAGGDPWAFARLPVWLPLVALDAALWWADYHLAQGVEPVDHSDVTDRLARARAFLGSG